MQELGGSTTKRPSKAYSYRSSLRGPLFDIPLGPPVKTDILEENNKAELGGHDAESTPAGLRGLVALE